MNLLPLIRPELAIIFDCGTDDFFYEVNEKLHHEMLYRNIQHDYTSRPGGHEDAYWNNSVEYHLLFSLTIFKSTFKIIKRIKMDNDKGMSRREALKRMGTVAVSAALATSGFAAVDNLTLDNKRMKILAINGSSRRDGNTADMLNLVLGELEKEGYETEHIQLAGQTINPCKACFACAGKKNCVFGNDIFRNFTEK